MFYPNFNKNKAEKKEKNIMYLKNTENYMKKNTSIRNNNYKEII